MKDFSGRFVCSLADVLRERGRLSDGEVRAVAAAAAAALARVHASGRVHGDVKPATLLLSRDGGLWLTDLGSAAPAERRLPGRGRAAPGPGTHPRADLRALGVTLIELATGIPADAGIVWKASELPRLGCSPALSSQIAALFDPGSTAEAVAGEFERSGVSALPVPVVLEAFTDPTPTVEFMPVRPPPASPAGAGTPSARPAASKSRWASVRACWTGGQTPSSMSQASRSRWVSRRTTRRAAPSATNTTAGRRTLL